MTQERSDLVFLRSHDIPVYAKFSWADDNLSKRDDIRVPNVASAHKSSEASAPDRITWHRRPTTYTKHVPHLMTDTDENYNEPDSLQKALRESLDDLRGCTFQELDEAHQEKIRDRIWHCLRSSDMEGPVYGLQQLRSIQKPTTSQRGEHIIMALLVNVAVLYMHYTLMIGSLILRLFRISHHEAISTELLPFHLMIIPSDLYRWPLSWMYTMLPFTKPQPIPSIPIRDRVLYMTQEFAAMIRTSVLPRQWQQCKDLTCILLTCLYHVSRHRCTPIYHAANMLKFVYGLGIHKFFYHTLYMLLESLIVAYETLTSPAVAAP